MNPGGRSASGSRRMVRGRGPGASRGVEHAPLPPGVGLSYLRAMSRTPPTTRQHPDGPSPVAGDDDHDTVRKVAGDTARTDIQARLRSVAGHLGGIQRMVDEDAYCMDIVNQVLAVQRALKKVNTRILDRHLHSCAVSAIQGDDPEERERVIGEILAAFEAAGRG